MPTQAAHTLKVPKKRGPKPKPLSERKFKPSKPIVRVERSYSKRRKEEVIMWLLNHKVYDPFSPNSKGGIRKPTFREAGQFFNIPFTTLGSWFRNRRKIIPDLPPGEPETAPTQPGNVEGAPETEPAEDQGATNPPQTADGAGDTTPASLPTAAN
ncbi:hypothetical protein B0T10DRAFT_556996 [Thelonectria olida]|uniref:Uncharacterized protein n=1 Tax=Thelonectria olida TaxID=1576542 RepID=A0A9P9AVI0_9HYPO|nr:hypothetical protein B0T10DRAFT_556996 [Thelonectria olida]